VDERLQRIEQLLETGFGMLPGRLIWRPWKPKLMTRSMVWMRKLEMVISVGAGDGGTELR
jgi:hypothetical protein